MNKKFFTLLAFVFNIACVYGAEHPQRRRGHRLPPLSIKEKRKLSQIRKLGQQRTTSMPRLRTQIRQETRKSRRRLVSLPTESSNPSLAKSYKNIELFGLILQGDKKAIQELDTALQHGTDSKGESLTINKKIYRTPLVNIAAAHGTPEVFRYLIQHGAVPSKETFIRAHESRELLDRDPRTRVRKVNLMRAKREALRKLLILKEFYPEWTVGWEKAIQELKTQVPKRTSSSSSSSSS